MNVAAIAVAFDHQRDLSNLISDALSSVDRFILVDNSAEGHPALAGYSAPPGCTILSNRNTGGLAGAYNLALATIRQRWPKSTHVLFLDDDTAVSSRTAEMKQVERRRDCGSSR